MNKHEDDDDDLYDSTGSELGEASFALLEFSVSMLLLAGQFAVAMGIGYLVYWING